MQGIFALETVGFIADFYVIMNKPLRQILRGIDERYNRRTAHEFCRAPTKDTTGVCYFNISSICILCPTLGEDIPLDSLVRLAHHFTYLQKSRPT